ncbi:alpha/beta fold hydrolase [uncultured Xylophilus sp.]|uniref:RBBP9/YdeN family alpha/beta hydrolase n=1 Tax=uncultured Xylophilus sp. TaxID=296832 RepID=UPI0025CF5677|nr:alpha/beta fold hydrolase [uncultured Xylophilus sp.]
MHFIADDPPTVLTLPGWHGSGPDHWQTRWEALYGYRRVEQHDWARPLRGDWCAQLDTVVADTPGPVVLVAHSLGCWLVAAWAAHSRHAAVPGRVQAALLVAPPDIARPDLQAQLPGWARTPLQPLPFAAQVVASSDDPYGSEARVRALAAAWGAPVAVTGPQGHLNADAGLGDWPAGHTLLQALLARTAAGASSAS